MSVPTDAVLFRTASPVSYWWLKREAALNWLALGLLLGAWNAADDRTSHERPEALRAYGAVSVRAVHRGHSEP